jgi:hypothetical protein
MPAAPLAHGLGRAVRTGARIDTCSGARIDTCSGARTNRTSHGRLRPAQLRESRSEPCAS